MGKDCHGEMLRMVESFLGKPKKSLTSHCWRRSTATVLANSGISAIGLKRAGKWKNLQTAEEYLEHSAPVLKDRMSRLSGEYKSEGDMTEDGNQVLKMVLVR